MNYRKDKYGNDISILGYGCMRFSKKAGRIDLKKTNREIMTAFRNGVNYFDTAYVYPGSEAALGKILSQSLGFPSPYSGKSLYCNKITTLFDKEHRRHGKVF